MNKGKKHLFRKCGALLLAALMASSSMSVFAGNSYVTDNTEEVMNNASSEGGGMVHNLPAPSAEEFKELKVSYQAQGLYDKPASAGETKFPGIYPREDIEIMDDDEIEPIVEAMIKTMTFEEKLALIADPGWGADKVEKGQAMYLPGVPRLGVPVVRQHDGPAGATAIYPTTNLPTQTTHANSFSTDLTYEYGAVIGKELVSIGSNFELGTQFDLTRDPRWMRAKDTFGEDYYAVGELAVAETAGLQAQGAGAEAKHVGAYATGGDGQLWTFVDEQTLHTAYLYTFEQPAKRANLSQMMTTYTRLNGCYTFSNEYMLKTVFREMWDWRGATVTDAMSQTEFSTGLGIDSEMGKKYNTEEYVLLYMSKGLFSEGDLDTAVSHVLWSLGYVGYLGLVEVDEETGLCYEDSARSIKDDGSIHYVMAGTDVHEGGDRAVIELEDTWAEDNENGLYDENNEVALQSAEQGIVLLKNEDGTLPLTRDKYTGDNKVAMIGWGADNIVSGTGSERSSGFLDYMTTPYESVKAIAGEDANIDAYVLEDAAGKDIPADMIFTSEDADENGWNYTDNDGSQSVVDEINYLTTYLSNRNSIKNLEDGKAFQNGEKNAWTGYLKAPQDGDFSLVIQTLGGSADLTVSSLDGSIIGEKTSGGGGGGYPGGPGGGGGGSSEPVPSDTITASASASALAQDNFTREGMTASSAKVTLEEGKLYKVEVSAAASSDSYDQQVRLGLISPNAQEDAQAEALAAAAEENTTVVCFVRVGPTGHGGSNIANDQMRMDTEDVAFLKELQARCSENGNKLAVVTYNRSAYSFDGGWLDDTDALMAAFYPGQAGGTAIANLLTGKTNPSGKLSVTMPKSYKDMLLYWEEWDTNGNGEYDEGEDYENYLAWQRYGQGAAVFYQGTRTEYYAQYNEGLYFGYRWYDFKDIQPQYAYGYGLSYTDFAYSDIAVDDRGDEIDVTVTVTNTGDCAGAEIVQAYLGEIEVPDNVQMSEKQLAAFGRTGELQPGQSETITMTIGERMLSYWDDSIEDDDLIEYDDGTKGKWVLAEGERELYVGDSSDNLTWSTTVYPEHITEANKTTLNKVIAYAEEQMEKDDYRFVAEEIREGFEATLEHAKTVSADLRSTQKETEEAWTTLVKWVHGLGIMTGDKTLLLEAITAAGGYNLDNYVEDGKQAFWDALSTAQAVYEDRFVKQDAIDEAADALVDAILALRLKASTANLDALLSQARTMDLSLYTGESADQLRTAIAEADAVLCADPSIDEQEAVDNAEANLKSSIDGLVKLDDFGSDDSGEDDTSREEPAVSDSGKDTSGSDQNAGGSPDTKPGSDVAGFAGGKTSSASASGGKKKNVYTGDAAPIAFAAGAILLGGIGVLLTKRKKSEE